MSKIQVDTIDTRSGTSTMQIGSTNTTTITLGVSGDTINVPSGVTIANAGTATGFGGANTPNFYATNSTNQSISASTWTTVIYNNEVWDTASLYDTSTGKFTVTSDYTGKYWVFAGVKFASSSISRLSLELEYNGSTAKIVNELGNGTSYPSIWLSGFVNLSSASDYIRIQVNQNDGTKTLSAENESNYFGAFKVIE